MKKVVDKHSVAHLWANQLQDEARVSCGNFYFNGKTIYSYGSHFPIAKHENGIVLFTKRTYSNTTAKHISIVRGACSHLEKIYCYYIDGYSMETEHRRNINQWAEDIKALLDKIKTARKKEMYFNQITILQDEAKKYCSFFKIKPAKEAKALFNYQFADALQYAEKVKQAEERENKKIETMGKKQYLRYVQLWHDCTPVNIIADSFTPEQRVYAEKYASKYGYTLLRVNSGEVETSKGVKLPIDVAKRYLNSYLTGKMKQGDEVLNYKVSRVDSSELVIGCHTIPQSEIKYISGVL